jgi:raffinose/stachyose/melibiose transport system substrate-binding protein
MSLPVIRIGDSRRPASAALRAAAVIVLMVLAGPALIAAPQKPVQLRMYAFDYTPRERAQSDRWAPASYLWTLRDSYGKLHPEVQIEFLPYIAQSPEYDAWFVTQFKAGNAPDVGNQLFSEVNRNANKGWFLDLTPYLDRPNPYVDGNAHWRDIFLPGVVQTGTAPDGKIYVLPTGITGTAIYYNKDIFRKAGVSVPQTWKEFIEVQRKIKEAGFIPFAFNMNGARYCSNWALRCLQDMLLDSRLSQIKGVLGRIERTMTEGSGVTQKELVAAIKRGTYSALDLQWQEQLRLLKEWSQYWDPGFLGLDQAGAYTEFITGKAAMFWDSSARVKPVTVDSLRTFDFGTFGFPKVTKESSQYATGIDAPAIGGFTANGGEYVVDALTVKRGTLEASIDWLMYITAPQNYVPMANDLGAYAPALKEVKNLDPALDPFLKSVQKGVFRIESYLRGLTVKYADQFYQVLQEYLADRKDLATACTEIQRYMIQAADDLIATNSWTDIK